MAERTRIDIEGVNPVIDGMNRRKFVTRQEMRRHVRMVQDAAYNQLVLMAPVNKDPSRLGKPSHPRQTIGNLKRSAAKSPVVETIDFASAEVTIGGRRAPYARAVDSGSGLFGPRHSLIKPRTAPAMRWFGRGRWWNRRTTRGQKGQHFVRQAALYARSKSVGAVPDIRSRIGNLR